MVSPGQQPGSVASIQKASNLTGAVQTQHLDKVQSTPLIGDENMTKKAMRRAVTRNLDGRTVGDSGSPCSPSNPSPLPPGMPNSLSRISLSNCQMMFVLET